jgi:hypothetical protein
MLPVLFALAHEVAAQVDPLQGTATAQKGAVQRIAEPTYYDYVFPAIAFLLVIVLPTLTALWVVYRTVTEKKAEADET